MASSFPSAFPTRTGPSSTPSRRRLVVPLLVASDFENGGPGMRINHSYALPTLLPQGGGTSFPPTMAFGAIGDDWFAKEYGRITAEEARAVGVHLNFAPVLDVNSNPLNPIINTRSFGEDPQAVARLGVAYLAGAREGGVMTTAKHFPGHGDTKTDSHVELPIVDADQARLDTLELVPFRRAVEAGVDAVMTAHVAVPEILGPEGPPATLSPYFLTDLLRNDMGFRGLILTDAIRMRAISEGYGVGESAILALEAGADVILAPADVWETLDAVESAVQSGRLSRERIDRSVRRILEMKARVGLLPEPNRGCGPNRGPGGDCSARGLRRLRCHAIHHPPPGRGAAHSPDPVRFPRVLHVVYAREEDPLAGTALTPARELFPGGDDPPSGAREPGCGLRKADLGPRRVGPCPGKRLGATSGGGGGGGRGRSRSLWPASSKRVPATGPRWWCPLGNPYLLTSFPDVGTYLLGMGSRMRCPSGPPSGPW